MPSNKNRLYIAVYPSGIAGNAEQKYHWGFLIGPKTQKGETPGTRYHVKNYPEPIGWRYTVESLNDVRMTNMLLARVLIAKIEDEQALISLFQRIPVVQRDPAWRCRTWVANVLKEIEKDGKCVGSAVLDWEKIETFIKEYAGKKMADGRYHREGGIRGPRPTWDLLENREIIA